MSKKEYKAADLFAGVGGIRLGFEQAFEDKIKFVYANEIDNFACETYKANFGEDPSGDIRKVDPRNIPDFDILLAGFPCQAFSRAGKKRGFNDRRGNLFFYISDILEEKKPAAFLLENVKHLRNHDKGRTFKIIKDILVNELRYYIHYKVLNAADYELPQNRRRIYIVGFKQNLRFKFPNPQNKKRTISDILESEVNEKYYLSQQYLDTLKKHKERHRAKGHGFGYEVLDRNEIANTIVVGGMGKERNLIKDKIRYDHWTAGDDPLEKKNDEGIRKLTEREWARLQGFPDDFEFPVAMTHIYKQVANSVPIPVINAIAKQMKKAMDEHIVLESNRRIQKKLEAYF